MTLAPPNTPSVAEAIHRAARRIFQAERQQEWSSAVLDAARGFCGRAALFTVQGSRLELERASFETVAVPVAVAPSDAPAVAQALETLEPVVSAWSVRELSPALVACFGSPDSGRAFLFPVVSRKRSVALLVAAEGALDPNGLELISTLAGAAWELRRARNNAAAAASKGLVTLGPKPAPAPEDSELHQRARRYASVRVAELRLYQAAKVREGREARNLYDLFQEEIDHDRAVFQAQFMEKAPSMADYLHEELVRTLAQGDPDRMGENYPGAMVHR
jgi:hypothetical protein